MNETLPDMERRKVELDRMMENLRESICSEQHSLESLKLQKRVLIDKISELKDKQPKP